MSFHIAAPAWTLLTSGGRGASEKRIGDWAVYMGEGLQVAALPTTLARLLVSSTLEGGAMRMRC